MHIAQLKKLDVHKTKQKRDRNRTTTSLVLDSSMQRGIWEFRLNQRIWLRLSSVFESRQISFFKIFLVSIRLLHANVQCVYIVKAKYQIAPLKAVVEVDWPMKAPCLHIQKPY